MRLFVTDVSAEKVKIVTRLEERISFLAILGALYATFGIHSKGGKPQRVSLKQAKQNVTKFDYVRGTVSMVKRSVTSCLKHLQRMVHRELFHRRLKCLFLC